MATLAGGTYASPNNSYYAPASAGASNWYNFPSLNGEIKLLDASGIQILKSVDSNLFFNNELLAKAGDISSIADWSIYPALSTLVMNSNSIVGASNIGASTVQTSSLTASLVSTTTLNTSSIRASGNLDISGNSLIKGSLQTSSTTILGSLNAVSATIGTGLGTNVTIANGGITANSSVSAVGLTTTSGLNMSNSAITNTTTIGISANGFPPYGQLSSPDGTSLTWNGAVVNTGGAGSASNWSFYPQLSNLTTFTATQISTASLGVSSINGIAYPDPTGNITQWALNPALSTVQLSGLGAVNVSSLTGVSSINNITYVPTQQWSGYFAQGDVVMDGFTLQGGTNKDLNLTSQASNVNITSGNNTNVVAKDVFITADTGASVNTPQVKIVAQNGPLGGNIEIDAQPSFGALAGFGSVTINAYGSSNNPIVPVGGLISLNAYSAGLGDYGGLTSAIRATAATIGLSAGALPSIPATAGTLNLYGNNIVSITSGLPGILPQIPGTIYQYAPVGINMESPLGITANNSFYTGNIYPIANGSNPLVIQGRSLPTAGVQLKDIELMNMVTGLGQITAVSSINNMALGNASLSNVSSISVSTINGFAFPQTVVIPSTFVDLYASTIEVNSIEPLNGSTIFVNASTILLTAYDRVKIVSGSSNPSFLDLSGGDIGRVYNILGASETDVNIVSTKGINITSIDDAVNINASSMRISTNIMTISTPSFLVGDVSGYFMSLNNTTNTITLGAPIVDVALGDITNVVNIIGPLSTNLSAFSYVDLGIVGGSNTTVEATTGVLQLLGQTDVNIDSTAGGINLATTTQVLVETSQLNMNNNKITNLSTGTAALDGVNYTQLTFKDVTEFYVSAQGSDTNNGSILAPFQTIQAAITAAELVSSAASVCNINVASGNYTENLTFNKGYVTLTGTLQSQTGNETCEITGSITIACAGANDVFNRQVTFQGFNITHGAAQSTTDTSTASHTVTFQDCKIFCNSVFFNSTTSAPDMRFYMTNVEVSQSNAAFTGAVITTNVGLVEFERMDLNLTGNATGIVIGGTSVLNRCSLSAFEASSTAAILRALLQINSTTTSTHSLGNVAFAFSSAVAKTNTNALYINSGINTAIIMLNCVFTLGGTANSTNFCVGYSGVGSPTIAGVNNTSLSVNVLLPQTVTVQTGITQISYIDINPPGLATYSSSADQTIAVSGTPQALTFNTTQFNQGTTLLLNSRVYANAQGNYSLNYSVELQHTGVGPTQLATTFLKKNGTTIANTGRTWTISSASFQNAAMAEFVVALNAGDYIEVFFSGDTSLLANATAAAGALPAIPSVVLNVKQFR